MVRVLCVSNVQTECRPPRWCEVVLVPFVCIRTVFLLLFLACLMGCVVSSVACGLSYGVYDGPSWTCRCNNRVVFLFVSRSVSDAQF